MLHLSAMDTIFRIIDYLPSTITTRKAIKIIDANLPSKGAKDIVFDFKNVGFISRAFADELIHFIERNSMNSNFINTNPTVDEMLKAVMKNRHGRENNYHKIAVTHFKEKEQLDHLLSLI